MGTVNYRVADNSLRCVKLVVSLQHLPSTGSSSGDCAVSLRRWLKLPSATSLEASTSLDSEVHSVLLVGSALLCLTSAKGLWVFGSMPFCQSFFLTLEFQIFLISLSVLLGHLVVTWDHLFIDVSTVPNAKYVYGPRLRPYTTESQVLWDPGGLHLLHRLEGKYRLQLPASSRIHPVVNIS